MLDNIDLILQIIATASLFIVTMLSFEPIQKTHRILGSKKTLYISLIVMWSSGISLIFVEHHINSIEKMKTSREKDSALKYQKETIGALKNQMIAEKTYQQKADDRHKADSANYANSLFMVRNSIEKGNSYLEAPFITIDKLPVYTLHNPYKVYREHDMDSARLVFEIGNNSKVPAKNIDFCYWLFWQKEDGKIYIDSMDIPFERERTKSVLLGDSIKKLTEYTIFTDFLPSKMHYFRHVPAKKQFYIYFKLEYTNKQNIQQPPLRKIYSVEFLNTDTVQNLFHSYIKEVDDYTYQRNVEILEKLKVW